MTRMAAEPLYRFRFFDDARKCWMVAGYRASVTTIKGLYARYQLMGRVASARADAGRDRTRLRPAVADRLPSAPRLAAADAAHPTA